MKKGFFTAQLKAAVALILSLTLLLSGCSTYITVETDPTGNTTVTQHSTQATTDGTVGTTEATEGTTAQEEQTDPSETGNQAGNQTGSQTNNQSGNQTNNQTTTNNQTPSQNQGGTQSSGGVGKGQASPVSLSAIPAFSGKPYVAVDGNVPNFSAAELTSKGYEKYSNLDGLGRVLVAVASVGKDTMPGANEERGSISSIKPTGWVQAQYDCVSGKYLYNRCHLIGWQLSAENANKSNLITGTKYLNITGMLPFENMVADYIKETGNHVAYRVTPIYSGNELVARGVQMEAYSVEDDGEGICFNVYCYNVQPEVTIDYATGKSTGPASENSGNNSSGNAGVEADYILNKNSKKFHHPNCSSVDKMKEENKIYYTGTREKLIEDGYDPCGNCDP